MKLMTKAIEKKAQAQYKLGSSMNQKVVAKFFDPCGPFTWYLLNQSPEDPDYLWGLVKGFEIEMGSFSLSELQNTKTRFGLGIERDKWFNADQTAQEIWDKLMKGEHV